MQFTKLRLLGFKSFVDPTELVISSGLTGVVGPNGCGKSNLLEALRWVMGENRAKAMRGSGMEDVIFAGAESRPARNYAEVSLTIDNSDRVAPIAFNEADTLDVVRRITRDAGSAYKVLGKDVRARDVQMLFADASTGAHSPSLVRQGQISELVNAKPKARRRVLEEAAGISGLYQRRHEAELKLNGTRTNLTRVDDVLEQLAQQLSQLARQAKQAARYREIAEALRRAEGVLLFRRWAEADQALMAAKTVLVEATQGAAQRQAEAARLATARAEAEAAVPPLREEHSIAGAVLQRLVVEHDQLADEAKRAAGAIRAMEAQLEELHADESREAQLAEDATGQIETLKTEEAALVAATAGHDAALAGLTDAARVAGEALSREETGLDGATEDLARLEARQQALARRQDEARELADKAAHEQDTAQQAVKGAEDGLAAAETALDAARKASGGATEAAGAAETALTQAEAALAECQTSEAEARAATSEATGHAKTLRAETQSLERLVERDRREGGQILDEIAVEAGYEAALGAALADDLKSPVATDGQTGWHALAPYSTLAPLPAGATALTKHVKGPASLARRLASVGIVSAEAARDLMAHLAPGQRLVTVEGDLWRWDGFVLRADDAPSVTARVLQQRNELAALAGQLETAEAALADAEAAHKIAREALDAAEARERDARAARRSADQAAAEATRALNRAEAEREMLAGRLDTLTHAAARRAEDATSAAEMLAEATAEMEGLEDLSSKRAGIEAMKIAVAAARAAMLEARGAAEDARREAAGRERRLETISQELTGWTNRQASAGARIEEFGERLVSTRARLETARAKPAEIEQRETRLAASRAEAEARLAKASDALAEAETALRSAEEQERNAERAASEAREARAAADARAEAAGAQVAQAVERIAEEADQTPEGLLKTIGGDPDDLPGADKAEVEVAQLKRQRDALGAVNLRAEEDAEAVEAEYNELSGEKADLEAAVDKLTEGIESLNSEGRTRLLSAFEDVNRNFAQLFSTLFGGGEANLVLVESDDPLEAGLEIMCQPPGKKLSTLSLLSGGEQTLTALSLIFAVFLANPSPICVLDEVDAPLDDANVTRFCDLLDEMTRKTNTRFLIITHHAVTMSRMNRLFGVTMAEKGVSQLVSVDLSEATKLVA